MYTVYNAPANIQPLCIQYTMPQPMYACMQYKMFLWNHTKAMIGPAIASLQYNALGVPIWDTVWRHCDNKACMLTHTDNDGLRPLSCITGQSFMYHWSKGGTGVVQRSDSVPRVARSAALLQLWNNVKCASNNVHWNNVKCARTPPISSIGIHPSPLLLRQNNVAYIVQTILPPACCVESIELMLEEPFWWLQTEICLR